MPESPRPITKSARTTTPPKSASLLLLGTALDTTWRAFVPIIGGTFLGIWIDHSFHIAPVGTIICLVVGVVLSTLLITKQIRDIRKPIS